MRLPPRSPLSPILYNLYRAELLLIVPTLQLSIRQRHCSRRGYADDLALIRSGDSLEDTTEALRGDLEQVIEWGQERCSLGDRVASYLRHFANTRQHRMRASARRGLQSGYHGSAAHCTVWAGGQDRQG